MQEIVAIIDRSGSMAGKESDTIGGINATIDQLKKTKEANEKINFSLKFFDHNSYVRIRSLDIEQIRPIPVNELRPRGQTALLDAMGDTILFFINKKLLDSNSFESCIIYVATDGYENASKKYTNETMKTLIEQAKTFKIEILYLGANQDAIFESSKFGLDCNQAINYSERQDTVESAYRNVGNVAKRYRSGAPVAFTQGERQDSVM